MKETLDKTIITLYISEENEEKMKECLCDQLFVYSIAKLIYPKAKPKSIRFNLKVFGLKEKKSD